MRLANALLPLIDDKAPLEQGLAVFGETLERESSRMLAGKLGLLSLDREGDDTLVRELFELLQQVETDMTLFFRHLADRAGRLKRTTTPWWSRCARRSMTRTHACRHGAPRWRAGCAATSRVRARMRCPSPSAASA